MTKKDFELIAGVLRGKRPEPLCRTSYALWLITAESFAQALSDAHPRFDTLRFLAACGVEG